MTSPFYPGSGSGFSPPDRGVSGGAPSSKSRPSQDFPLSPKPLISPLSYGSSPYSAPPPPPPPFPRPSPLARAMGTWGLGLIALGVLWMPFGHVLLAGSAGWMLVFGMFMVAPAYVVIAGIHTVLSKVYAAKVGQKAVGPLGSVAQLVVILLIAVYPLFTQDFTDNPPGIPSRLTAWFGVPGDTAAYLWAGAMCALLGATALMLLADIIDVVRISRVVSAHQRYAHYYQLQQEQGLSGPSQPGDR